MNYRVYRLFLTIPTESLIQVTRTASFSTIIERLYVRNLARIHRPADPSTVIGGSRALRICCHCSCGRLSTSASQFRSRARRSLSGSLGVVSSRTLDWVKWFRIGLDFRMLRSTSSQDFKLTCQSRRIAFISSIGGYGSCVVWPRIPKPELHNQHGTQRISKPMTCRAMPLERY